MAKTDSSQKPPRLPVVDVVRGAAIIGVVFYHFVWDLRFFEFHGVNVDVAFGWVVFARSLLAAFLLLSGVSLVLAHRRGMRWPAFWRRLGVLTAAALAVTIGTYVLFPDAFVFFGVLHAIALFSLMAVPFLRLPYPAVLLAGLAVLAIGVTVRSDLFNVWYLSWLGFWTVPPLTQDLVPVFPSFGFTLLGVGGAQLTIETGLVQKLGGFGGQGAVWRVLGRAGRWSLFIYLVHQPLLLAILYPLAAWLEPGAERRAAEFVQSCQQSCEIGAGEAGFCQRYCACSLDQVETGDLWPIIGLEKPTLEQSQEVGAVARICSAMAADGAGDDQPIRP